MNEQKLSVFVCILDVVLENVGWVYIRGASCTNNSSLLCFIQFVWTLVTSTKQCSIWRWM